MKQKGLLAVILVSTILVTGIGFAFGDEHDQPNEPEIIFSEFQFVVIGIGVIAGFVTAYNGYAKNKREQGKDFIFDRSKFLDRVFMAILGSIPLAIAESANVIKLDLFGAWIIFAAALGTSQLIMEIRNRRSK